ncbi:hypothetical protein ACQP3F_28970, partial [Escherichia coli]
AISLDAVSMSEAGVWSGSRFGQDSGSKETGGGVVTGTVGMELSFYFRILHSLCGLGHITNPLCSFFHYLKKKGKGRM